MSRGAWLALLASSLLLGACFEKPQGVTRKSDGKPWENSDPTYLAGGYKPGDAAAWDKQITQRAQGQNEYVRINPAH